MVLVEEVEDFPELGDLVGGEGRVFGGLWVGGLVGCWNIMGLADVCAGWVGLLVLVVDVNCTHHVCGCGYDGVWWGTG